MHIYQSVKLLAVFRVQLTETKEGAKEVLIVKAIRIAEGAHSVDVPVPCGFIKIPPLHSFIKNIWQQITRDKKKGAIFNVLNVFLVECLLQNGRVHQHQFIRRQLFFTIKSPIYVMNVPAEDGFKDSEIPASSVHMKLRAHPRQTEIIKRPFGNL